MQPTRISDLRLEKTSTILRLFVGGDVLTRRDIEVRTGISYGTISIILRHLLNGEILERTGKVSSNGGRRADTYRLIPERAFFSQLSVTSYGFVWNVRDLHGTLRAHGVVPDDQSRSIDDIFTDAVGNVIESARSSGFDIQALGVSVPAFYDDQTDSIVLPSRRRLENLHIRSAVSPQFDGDVIVEADVNAAAYAQIASERETRSLQGTTVLVVVTADGIGSSIIIDGSIHYGASGRAGEIHVIPVTIDGETNSFGEVADSAAAATRLAEDAGLPEVPDYPALRSMIESGDARIESIYPRLVEAFAQALHVLYNILDPSRIILTGPYCGFGARWSADVENRLREIDEMRPKEEITVRQASSSLDLDLVGMWRLQADRWVAGVDSTVGSG